MAIASSDDFTSNALADLGVSVTWTPRTKTIDNRGDRSFSNGTAQTITAVIHLNHNKHEIQKSGELDTSDGYIMFDPQYNIQREDLITYNGQDYLVDDVVLRGPAMITSIYGHAKIYIK